MSVSMQGRIAVIRARGYLGRALVTDLVRSGVRVTGVGRHLPHAWPAGATFHICDATEMGPLRRAIGECTGIINAADGPPAAMLRVAQNLAACQATGWKGRLVQVSSLSVYGQSRGVLDEDHTPVPAPGHRYAQGKLAVEAVLSAGPGAERTIIVRPGCLYGPGSPIWVDRLCRQLLAGRLGWLWDEGAGLCPLIHVNDMAHIAINALAAGPEVSGVHNIPGPEGLTWNMYIRLLAEGLGMAALPRVSSMRVDFETYARGPVQYLLGGLGLKVVGPVTPAMRRLFRNQQCIGSRKAPLLAPEAHTRLQAGLSVALADFRRRTPQPRARAPHGAAHKQATA